MEWLQGLFEGSHFPLWSAFLLGLMTAISPCPLGTNITAIGYISRNLENKKQVFINGVIYTLGRAVAYVGLATLLFFGASQFHISGIFLKWGERLLGPVLVILGLIMLGVIRLNIPFFSKMGDRFDKSRLTRKWDVFLLGIVFALAFCPYSGVLYFGMLVPLMLSEGTSGLLLPVVFAIATGFPVILFAWLIAFAADKIAGVYDRLRLFERWFRRVVAILFIGVGIYYCWIFFLG